MRLIACSNCHTQYDVTNTIEESFPCRCGELLKNESLEGMDAKILRCGSCGAIVGGDVETCDYCSSEIVRDTRKLSLICPECYGRNSDDSRFCTACGVHFQPEQVQVDTHELPCPVCGCLMPARQIADVPINECPECNGIWTPERKFDVLVSRAIEARQSADPAKLAALKPRMKGANPARQQVEYRKCPVCEAFMQRRNFRKTSGVIIDRCHEHGVWLDADELEQIAGFILSGGRPRAARTLAEQDARSREDFAKARAASIAAQYSSFGRHQRRVTDQGGSSPLIRFLSDLLS